MSFGRSSVSTVPVSTATNDLEVSSPPSDGISSVKFSPAANHLIATSWDNQVRCWEIQSSGQSIPKASIDLQQPVLCCDWAPDGATVFAGEILMMARSLNHMAADRRLHITYSRHSKLQVFPPLIAIGLLASIILAELC